MIPEFYVRQVLLRNRIPVGEASMCSIAYRTLYPIVKQWANEYFLNFRLSGSYAKGTAVKGSTDLDFLVSISSRCGRPLGEMYNSLYDLLRAKYYVVRKQNVSLGISWSGLKIDLIPARKMAGLTSDHSLFLNKRNTWTKTNVQKHIAYVRSSHRTEEIRALKIWRDRREIELPSFLLELLTIEALRGKPFGQVAKSLWIVLESIAQRLSSARIVDPANSSNIVSDDLSSAERQLVLAAVEESLSRESCQELIW